MSEPLIAQINLKKLRQNAQNVKNLLASNVKACAVVKADAYGHGIVEISNCLYKDFDCFAVSLLKEAEQLRFAGIEKPILMLTPITENTVDRLILKGVTICIGSFKELKILSDACKRLNVIADVHIAINSGMNRLGFDSASEVKKAIKLIRQTQLINITGAMSHFGVPQNREYTDNCFNNFLKIADAVKQDSPNAILHISASGGLISNQKYHLDMVRTGILLYGYKPFETDKISVEPIMKILARNLLCRDNLKGKTLLYGDSLCKTDTATILRLGYADGFFRNTADMSANLCMDLCAIKGRKNQKYVSVLTDAQELAKKNDTISYEILTCCSSRAKKIYIDNN